MAEVFDRLGVGLQAVVEYAPLPFHYDATYAVFLAVDLPATEAARMVSGPAATWSDDEP